MRPSYKEQPVTAVPAIKTILWSVQKRITFSITPTCIIRFAHYLVGLTIILVHYINRNGLTDVRMRASEGDFSVTAWTFLNSNGVVGECNHFGKTMQPKLDTLVWEVEKLGKKYFT